MVLHLIECHHHPSPPLIGNEGCSPLHHPSIESTSYFTQFHLLSDMQEISHVFILILPTTTDLAQYSAVTIPMPRTGLSTSTLTHL